MEKSIAVERILETENLTDALDDDDANWLLDWGSERVGGLIAGIEDEEAAGAKVNQLMAVMRSLNQIAGERADGDSERLTADVRTLRDRYATAFGAAPDLDDAEIARLVSVLPTLPPREAIRQLLTHLEAPNPSPARPGTPSGAKEQQQPAPSPPRQQRRDDPGNAQSASVTQRLESLVSFARCPRGWVALPAILLAVVVVVAVIVGLLSRGEPARYVASPSVDITAYFAEPSGQSSGGIDEYVVADLDKAKQTVDIASFDFNLPSVANAATRAALRGVVVRVVVDEVNGSQTLRASDAPDGKPFEALRALAAAHIPVVDGGRSSGLMHNKFILIDHAVLFVGSWNLSFNDTFRNNNNLLRITDSTLIANYQAKFDELFVEKRFGANAKVGARTAQLVVDGSPVENYFSPPDRVMSKLVALVQGAKQSVRFLAFTYTHSDLSGAMIARAKAGVQVRGVIENRGASQGALPELYCAGIAVKVDGNPNTMHHKVLILDGQTVVTGSFNFTQSADKYNDDNVLVLHNSALAALYEQEFARVEGAGKQPASITCPAA
jgi:phosphatidylserine/phosphatidylglycerophosphate/cardiolipin synthase-like enzyme